MGEMSIFVSNAKREIERSAAAMDTFSSAQRWLGMRAETCGAWVIPLTTLVGWLLRNDADPGNSVIPLLWSAIIYRSCSSLVVDGIQAEARLVSVQRLVEYTWLPQERTPDPAHKDPTPPWPTVGKVEFKDVKMRYRDDLPLALNGTSFTVPTRWHCG